MDTLARSHRRAVWLTTLLAFTVFGGGFLGFELNWIHRRRALLGEDVAATGIIIENYMVEHENVREFGAPDFGFTYLPPLGSTVPQRLLGWLGERAAEQVHVYCVYDGTIPYGRIEPDGSFIIPHVDEMPKVIRARRLFPEAKVEAVLVRRGLFVPSTGRHDPALEAAISP